MNGLVGLDMRTALDPCDPLAEGQSGYVLGIVVDRHGQTKSPTRDLRLLRYLTSFGRLLACHGSTLDVGDVTSLRSVTGRDLGRVVVLGIRHGDGTVDGWIPNRRVRHLVAK